jgi:hypothetical protein
MNKLILSSEAQEIPAAYVSLAASFPDLPTTRTFLLGSGTGPKASTPEMFE